MCGTPRDDDAQFCKNCNFEFLVGKYVKVEDEKYADDSKITVEKVSQEEFVESNDILRQTKDKINYSIAKYLNNELTNQFNGKYDKNIDIGISEYISSSLNNSFDDSFEKNDLENIENLLHDEKFMESKNIFIQWIVENRGHLPGMVLNQYKIPIQGNVGNLKKILSLDLAPSDENEKFKNLLNDYLNFENEFLDNLI
ncbi:hypothetical protein [Methanobrevibacter sp.]|uniref:hypothetical protein n=1 Tax=Methanobrevibacter sp. TaxID=66852 RepID=UPI0025E24042|nr:hypothetical protein [Methanobrevibacter sp.]MBQ2961743.1 hypothetical protein [Methanobrevibacter sp.]